MSFQPQSVDIRSKYLNARQRQTKLLTRSPLQVRWLRWTNALRRRKNTAPRNLIHFEFCLFHQNRNLRPLHRIWEKTRMEKMCQGYRNSLQES